MALYDVRIMNGYGAWLTDTTTGSLQRALERGRFLLPRVPAVTVEDAQGRRAGL